MHKVSTKIVQLVVGALGIVTNNIEENLRQLAIPDALGSMKVSAVLGTAIILSNCFHHIFYVFLKGFNGGIKYLCIYFNDSGGRGWLGEMNTNFFLSIFILFIKIVYTITTTSKFLASKLQVRCWVEVPISTGR